MKTKQIFKRVIIFFFLLLNSEVSEEEDEYLVKPSPSFETEL